MGWILGAIIAGITAFVATNIDDIVILMLFFSRVNSTFRSRHIIVGQYLGFAVLIIVSLPGFVGGLALPRSWIGLLGLVPIIIGIKDLISRDNNDATVQAVSRSVQMMSPRKNRLLSALDRVVHPQSFGVAATTIANGGDNIGIYVSLFASSNLNNLLVILIVFFVLIGVWCYVAYRLTRQPSVLKIFTNYGQTLTPYILIGLGIFIVIESGTIQLLTHLPLTP